MNRRGRRCPRWGTAVTVLAVAALALLILTVVQLATTPGRP